MPLFEIFQLVPLLVDTKTPPCVPANRFEPMTANEDTIEFPSPLLTCIQLEPLLVVMLTPAPHVPQKTFEPITAAAWHKRLRIPPEAEVQLVPLFVEIKKPPVKPAQTFELPARRETTFELGNPLLTEFHCVPLLVDK